MTCFPAPSGLPTATADLCDLFGDRAIIVGLPWRCFGGKAAFHGPAATFAAQDDSALVRRVLETEGRGRVLVIDNRGSRQHAVFGDHFGALVIERAWAGVVIDGVLRDAESLRSMDIGVFALGTCPRRPRKEGAGAADAVLEIGGAKIAPGDWLAADADGVVVIEAAKMRHIGGA